MSDEIDVVTPVAAAGGGGILVFLLTRLFKSSDTAGMLMAQLAVQGETLKNMIGEVASLKADMRQIRERSEKALFAHRDELDALKDKIDWLSARIDSNKKDAEIASLKSEIEEALKGV